MVVFKIERAVGPKIRILNHWDNLDRSVERGYAGASIFNWHTLPGYIAPRYIDYARANASIGINAMVPNNVNANAAILSAAYIEKARALADALRPYGIKDILVINGQRVRRWKSASSKPPIRSIRR